MPETSLYCVCGTVWTPATASLTLICDPVSTGSDRVYRFSCPACGKTLSAEAPAEIPPSVCGVFGSDEWEEP